MKCLFSFKEIHLCPQSLLCKWATLWNRYRLTVSFLETLRGKKQKNRNFHQLKSEARHQFRRVMPACTLFFSFTSAIQTHVCSMQPLHHCFRNAAVEQLTVWISPSLHMPSSDTENAKSKHWEAACESVVADSQVHRILCSSIPNRVSTAEPRLLRHVEHQKEGGVR